MMIWDMFFLDVFGHFGPFFFCLWLWMLSSQDGQTFVLFSRSTPKNMENNVEMLEGSQGDLFDDAGQGLNEFRIPSIHMYTYMYLYFCIFFVFLILHFLSAAWHCLNFSAFFSSHLEFLSIPMDFSRRLTLNTCVAGVASNPCTCQLHLGCTSTNCQALVMEKEIQVLPEKKTWKTSIVSIYIVSNHGGSRSKVHAKVFPINFTCFRMQVTHPVTVANRGFLRIPYKNAANLDGDWNPGSGGRFKKSTVSVSHNQSCCPISYAGGIDFLYDGMRIPGCPRKLVNA